MNRILEVCLVVVTVCGNTTWAGAQSATPVLRKGVSVQMAVTSSAVAMPDADKEDALIVSVTSDGNAYFGVDPIRPAVLAERVKLGLSNQTEKKIYIKADARVPYASVAKVLEAARTAGVALPILLTQGDSPEAGTLVPPKGLPVLVDRASLNGAEPVVAQVLKSEQGPPKLKINNEEIPWAALQSALRQILQNRGRRVVLVKAEGSLPFADIVAVTDVCRSTGAEVVLLTSGV